MILQRRQVVSVAVSAWSTSFRYYGQRVIKPTAIREANVTRSGRRRFTPKEKYAKSEFAEIEPDVMESIQRFESLEPDISQFKNMHPQYERERTNLKLKIAQWRMAKKHFKEYMPTEISVLTYAEKESMRYLHHTDSEEWSAENLAMAFPTSVRAVKQLLRSPYRCRTVADIQRHDRAVAETLEKIRSGEIEMSPELEEKMKLRNSIPITLGATSTPELGLLVVEKKRKLGPFARLVSPDLSDDDEEDLPEPEVEVNESKPTSKWKSQKTPQLTQIENYGYQTLPHTVEESQLLAGLSRRRMTLQEFEKGIKKAQQSGKISQTMSETEQRKIEYLITADKLKSTNQVLPPAPEPILPGSDDYVPTPTDFLGKSQIRKYAPKLENEDVEVNVDEGKAYIYTPETGYQKPFAAREGRVSIPRHAQKEGSVYKIGDSYYDENGEFFYRPV